MSKEEQVNRLSAEAKELHIQHNFYEQKLIDLRLKMASYSDRAIALDTTLHQKRWVKEIRL